NDRLHVRIAEIGMNWQRQRPGTGADPHEPFGSANVHGLNARKRLDGRQADPRNEYIILPRELEAALDQKLLRVAGDHLAGRALELHVVERVARKLLSHTRNRLVERVEQSARV